eukprot:1159516-Pelagomonas_calceolata.AAC.4
MNISAGASSRHTASASHPREGKDEVPGVHTPTNSRSRSTGAPVPSFQCLPPKLACLQVTLASRAMRMPLHGCTSAK